MSILQIEEYSFIFALIFLMAGKSIMFNDISELVRLAVDLVYRA